MPTMKNPTAQALEPLYEALEEARQACIDACDDFAMRPDLDEVAVAFAAWVKAAEAWNAAVESLATQVDAFISAHADRWAASAKGEAFAAWSVALREAHVDTEPLDTLNVSITLDTSTCDLTVDNADDVLPETPEIPKLEA